MKSYGIMTQRGITWIASLALAINLLLRDSMGFSVAPKILRMSSTDRRYKHVSYYDMVGVRPPLWYMKGEEQEAMPSSGSTTNNSRQVLLARIQELEKSMELEAAGARFKLDQMEKELQTVKMRCVQEKNSFETRMESMKAQFSSELRDARNQAQLEKESILKASEEALDEKEAQIKIYQEELGSMRNLGKAALVLIKQRSVQLCLNCSKLVDRMTRRSVPMEGKILKKKQ